MDDLKIPKNISNSTVLTKKFNRFLKFPCYASALLVLVALIIAFVPSGSRQAGLITGIIAISFALVALLFFLTMFLMVRNRVVKLGGITKWRKEVPANVQEDVDKLYFYCVQEFVKRLKEGISAGFAAALDEFEQIKNGQIDSNIFTNSNSDEPYAEMWLRYRKNFKAVATVTHKQYRDNPFFACIVLEHSEGFTVETKLPYTKHSYSQWNEIKLHSNLCFSFVVKRVFWRKWKSGVTCSVNNYENHNWLLPDVFKDKFNGKLE